jgi:hypothetical protein
LWSDLKRPISWALRWRYLWMPPGWSPDKSTLTSNEIRARLRESAGTAG